MFAHFSQDLRTSRGQAIINAINAGTGPGSMLFYDGDYPGAGAAIITQNLLGTCLFAEPAGSVTNGVTTFNALTDDSNADLSGIVTWVRILDGNGAWVTDLSVTDNDGAGPVKMLSTTVYQGGVLHVASMVITEGNA